MLFILPNDLNKHIGSEARIRGWAHKIRKLGGMNFLMIRDRTGVAQAAIEGEVAEKIKGIGLESVLGIKGLVVKEDRAPGGVEIKAADIEIISKVSDEIPLEINKKGNVVRGKRSWLFPTAFIAAALIPARIVQSAALSTTVPKNLCKNGT